MLRQDFDSVAAETPSASSRASGLAPRGALSRLSRPARFAEVIGAVWQALRR